MKRLRATRRLGILLTCLCILLIATGTTTALAKVGHFTEYGIPTSGSGPIGITAGPDGNIWFTESRTNKIGKVTLKGHFTEYPLPTPNSDPSGITAGPDGNLWFTEYEGNQIGRITTGK